MSAITMSPIPSARRIVKARAVKARAEKACAVKASAVKARAVKARAVHASDVRPRLRITSRGRAVLSALIAGPFVVAFLALSLNGGPATATLEGSTASFEYVTVASGESLWQLAEDLAPTADPRDVILQIVQLNQLSSTEVYAGQELALPPQYSAQ